MPIFNYNRRNALAYAKKWALDRNEIYYNFDRLGGDCTNFASQCLYSGAPVMNFQKTFGWYYINLNDRSPAWTSVEYFYEFLTKNKSVGPFGKEVDISLVEVGDFIQLSDDSGNFYHTLIVSSLAGGIKVCAHTYDSLDRDFSTYYFSGFRCIKILGYNN